MRLLVNRLKDILEPALIVDKILYLFVAETANTVFDFLLVFQPLVLDFGEC